MKEKTMYVCELCNTQYSHKVDATSCESNHKRVKAFNEAHYRAEKVDNSGYPDYVILLMDNGQKIKYVRG